jgi:regulator of protease activity HflC (stomatin/prohibitin superfamily)
VLTEKDVSLVYGLVRLIAWDPTEGILLLRNKQVDFADDDLHDGKGGVRLVYPILGEELALRVPLEVQTLSFTDTNVLTREYLNLSIGATMKWRIENIQKFYLLVSRELRSTNEKAGEVEELAQTARRHARVSAQRMVVQLMNASVDWLRGLAQEQTRIVVSRVRSGLLIADRLMADVPEVRGVDALSSPPEFGGATDGLASAVHQTLSERLKDFGIAVVDVTLQEIKLPEEIVRQCVEAAKTAYIPLMSKRNATKRHAELKADVDLLGKEAVAAREVIANAPAYALRDFLSEFIVKTAKPAADAIKPTIDLTQLESIEDQAPKSGVALPDETKSNA